VKKLLVIAVALVLLFFSVPYIQYLSSGDSNVTVGVHYYYDSTMDIESDVKRIAEAGFKIIRIDAVYSTDASMNLATEKCLVAAKKYGLKVIAILYYSSALSNVESYVSRFGSFVDYYQLLNEIDIMKWWGSGQLYMDEEVIKMLADLRKVVRKCDSDAKTLTTVTAGWVIRIGLIKRASEFVDFIGIDVYEGAYYIFEQNYFYLKQVSGKEVWVTEFGSAHPDDYKQAEYLVNCLNKFKSLKVPVAIVFAWNNALQAIKDRRAEAAVKEWIRGG